MIHTYGKLVLEGLRLSHASSGKPPVSLYPQTARMLALLMDAGDHKVTLEKAISAVFGEKPPKDPAMRIRVCISRIRDVLKELEADEEVTTTRGFGYRLTGAGNHVCRVLSLEEAEAVDEFLAQRRRAA